MSKIFDQSSFLFGSNADFLEELYQLYLKDPSLVDPSWRTFFEQEQGDNWENSPSWALKSPKVILGEEKKASAALDNKQINNDKGQDSTLASLKAKFLINAYRLKGHYLAKLDPLEMEVLPSKSDLKLDIETFGFKEEDLSQPLEIGGEFAGLEKATLSELVSHLDKIYSGKLSVELAHVENFKEQSWIFEKKEKDFANYGFTKDEQKAILKGLMEVDSFEQYLHTKFPGAKRFSIEGGDSSIVAYNYAIELAASKGVEDVVTGMAHRGRLTSLTQVLRKPYRALLSEFMGTSPFPAELKIAGDVKYHMGYSYDHLTSSGHKVHLSLTPNPSHLEAVNPVVAGKVRAKQDLKGDKERKKVMGLLVHGDAAFCGQGVVAECLAMSTLEPYAVGGILHFVINNQVGFTANSYNTRPGRYATEVAKMYGAPIFHVNGDDIEAVLTATNIAVEYRQTFGKDVVIDIVCYRKYGHNEGDEPMYTQPLMYNAIKNKKAPDQIYANKLITSGVIDENYYTKLKEDFKSKLNQEYEEAKNYKPEAQWLTGAWSGIEGLSKQNISPKTGIPKEQLIDLGLKLCHIPPDFKVNSKILKLLQQRSEVLNSDQPIDWATAEQLAFASLLQEKIPIRLTGQDVARGTFSHRHSVLHSQGENTTFIPLNNLGEGQAKYEVADSNLSEYGVLGFEYGFSQVNPRHLVIWEAQFGDFANGAQIIFDQFISSSETKWLRLSGLVVLLPHALEGQGPEHSSARLERFLQLAADDNMRIVYPTTPASIFHLLRRQIHSNIRKPLIVMTPKSLLRHKFAVSNLNDLASGSSFKPILNEVDNNISAQNVKKVILCAGKVYYDLIEKRAANKINNIAILRLEQLYPLSVEDLSALLKNYQSVQEWIWCQEEPKNMGAWSFVSPYLNEALQKNQIKSQFNYIGREAAASPAVGSLYLHTSQQDKLIKQALNIGD